MSKKIVSLALLFSVQISLAMEQKILFSESLPPRLKSPDHPQALQAKIENAVKTHDNAALSVLLTQLFELNKRHMLETQTPIACNFDEKTQAALFEHVCNSSPIFVKILGHLNSLELDTQNAIIDYLMVDAVSDKHGHLHTYAYGFSVNGYVYTWDLTRGKLVGSQRHTLPTKCVKRNETCLTIAPDGLRRISALVPPLDFTPETFIINTHDYLNIALGTTIIAGLTKEYDIELLSKSDWTIVRTLTQQSHGRTRPHAIFFNPNGDKLYCALENNALKVYDVHSLLTSASTEAELILEGHTSLIMHHAWRANGILVTASPHEIIDWHYGTPKFESKEYSVKKLASNANFALAYDNEMRAQLLKKPLHEAWKIAHLFPKSNQPTCAISCNNVIAKTDGSQIMLYTVGDDGGPSVDFRAKVQRHTAPITHLEFSPDGNYLLSTAHDGKVVGWNIQAMIKPLYGLSFNDVLVFGTIMQANPQERVKIILSLPRNFIYWNPAIASLLLAMDTNKLYMTLESDWKKLFKEKIGQIPHAQSEQDSMRMIDDAHEPTFGPLFAALTRSHEKNQQQAAVAIAHAYIADCLKKMRERIINHLAPGQRGFFSEPHTVQDFLMLLKQDMLTPEDKDCLEQVIGVCAMVHDAQKEAGL